MTRKKRKRDLTWQDVEHLDRVRDNGGDALISLSRSMEYGLPEADVLVTRVSVRAPDVPGGEYFVVVNAVVEGQRSVGFGSGMDVISALGGTVARITNGTMKWREDDYAQKRESQE